MVLTNFLNFDLFVKWELIFDTLENLFEPMSDFRIVLVSMNRRLQFCLENIHEKQVNIFSAKGQVEYVLDDLYNIVSFYLK